MGFNSGLKGLNLGVNLEIFGWKMKGGRTAGKT
jgi:hypothetical protein